MTRANLLCLALVFFVVGISSIVNQANAFHPELERRVSGEQKTAFHPEIKRDVNAQGPQVLGLQQLNEVNAGARMDLQFEAPEKEAWPELRGKNGEEAKAVILSEFPKLKVHVLDQGAFVTMDMRMDRVRIFVNKEGNVVGTPRIG
jgi:hypothetical protein